MERTRKPKTYCESFLERGGLLLDLCLHSFAMPLFFVFLANDIRKENFESLQIASTEVSESLSLLACYPLYVFLLEAPKGVKVFVDHTLLITQGSYPKALLPDRNVFYDAMKDYPAIMSKALFFFLLIVSGSQGLVFFILGQNGSRETLDVIGKHNKNLDYFFGLASCVTNIILYTYSILNVYITRYLSK